MSKLALFFDTETTGFPSKEKPVDIIQIGAMLQDTEGDRRVLGELNTLIETKQVVPQKLVDDVHGISNDLLRRFSMTPEAAAEPFFAMLLAADVVVAHNLAFDISVIKQYEPWAIMMNIFASKQEFCTMRESTDVIKMPPGTYHGGYHSQYKPPKLMEAYFHFFGREFDGAHDAMADVRACRGIYFVLQDLQSA